MSDRYEDQWTDAERSARSGRCGRTLNLAFDFGMLVLHEVMVPALDWGDVSGIRSARELRLRARLGCRQTCPAASARRSYSGDCRLGAMNWARIRHDLSVGVSLAV